jgi:glycine cleavage system H protein
VVFVELPKTGRKVSQGEAIAVVESVKAAFDIYTPLSGEIAVVNSELAQNPALLNQSPHEKGWLLRIKPSDPKELSGLMEYEQYQDFIKTATH